MTGHCEIEFRNELRCDYCDQPAERELEARSLVDGSIEEARVCQRHYGIVALFLAGARWLHEHEHEATEVACVA